MDNEGRECDALPPFFCECALWVLFAPNFRERHPHLRQANCGVAPLFGTKIPPQNPLAGSGVVAQKPPHKTHSQGQWMGAGETGETRKVGNPIPPISPVLPVLPVLLVLPATLVTLVTPATLAIPATLVTLATPATPATPATLVPPATLAIPCSSLSVGSRGCAHKKAESSVCTVQPRTPPIELWRLWRAFYAFLIAATPGSSLPSINSSSAPPPVET